MSCHRATGPQSGSSVDTVCGHNDRPAQLVQQKQRFVRYRLLKTFTVSTETLAAFNFLGSSPSVTGSSSECPGASALHIVVALAARKKMMMAVIFGRDHDANILPSFPQ